MKHHLRQLLRETIRDVSVGGRFVVLVVWWFVYLAGLFVNLAGSFVVVGWWFVYLGGLFVLFVCFVRVWCSFVALRWRCCLWVLTFLLFNPVEPVLFDVWFCTRMCSGE